MSDIFSNMQFPITAPPTVAAPAASEPIAVKDALPASNVQAAQPADSVELSSKPKKQGPIKTIKNGIANIKKTFATAGEYVKGTFKGIKNGAIAGSIIYTGGSILNHVKAKNAAKAGVESFKKMPNKALAIIAAGIALAGSLWNASLNATEKKSDIDHRWTGHKQ